MSLKNVHYQKLETEESDLEDDELPPSHVKLQSTNHVKGKDETVRPFRNSCTCSTCFSVLR